jgi:hypothetical protein
MSLSLKYKDPTVDPNWDQAILAFPEANIFHSASWARTLMNSYGYRPLYATWERQGTLVGVAPLMEVNSILTGRRGVSLPFTDWCPIITDGSVSRGDILETLVELGKSRHWKSLELRDSHQSPKDDPASFTYMVHELDLGPGADDLYSGFRDSTRRNIRKAAKLGVTIIEDNNYSALREFCRLNAITRREHGLPPQPPVFFQNLHRNVVLPGNGRILFARYREKTIASAVYLSFNSRVLYKYGASDRTMQHLRANNLLMWEAIKRFAGEGNRSFHFGRTNSDQEGLLQFKRGWGAVENGLQYQKFSLPDGLSISSSIPVFGFHNRVFARLPLPALGLIGKVLYRHVG